MKLIFCLLLTATTMSLSAQELNKKIHDVAHNQNILINACTREGVANFPEFKEMFDPLYSSYTPDSTIIAKLKPFIGKTHIKIVLGTWCGDSKVYVPQFFKILDGLSFPAKSVEIIAVDGYKKAENGIIDSLNILQVPTFIVYNKENKEIGRIIEHPKATLEADLFGILKGKE